MKKRNYAKDNLIPFEQSKRIIRLDRRGRGDTKRIYGAFGAGVVAVCCLLYCLSILLFMGYGTKFFLIWAFLAVFFGGLAILLQKQELTEKIPMWIKKAFWILFVTGIVFLLIVEGMICTGFHAKADAGADYVIVLGAQWKSQGPSYVLQKRLDAAVEYLRKNPDTCVIVSGGQGSNELISEAQGMAEYLENAGIETERILQEDRSTNTKENLEFSSAYLDKSEDRVVIVTNNFHVFRALKLAKKQGYAQVEGLAAGSYPAMLPNNLLREFFGVLKDFLAGNL